MRKLVVLALISAGMLCGGERMSVSVCNFVGLSKTGLARAEAEAAMVFDLAGVEIEWESCGEQPTGARLGINWFTIRLREYKPTVAHRRGSPDAMGTVFLSEDGDGYRADCFYSQIQNLARQRQADASSLLGQVMAHELGHFLLGPRHSRNSIMRAEWIIDKRAGMRQQWVRFTRTQGKRMRQRLHDAHLLLVASR